MEHLEEFNKEKFEDYYHVLGANELSSVEQILTEYRIRARQYHPDKTLPDKNCCENFVKLQEAKEVLTNPKKRKDYDKWRKSGIQISYQRWVSLGNSIKMSMHWATVKHDPMISVGNEESQESTSSSLPSDNFSDILKKFRNYEI